MRVTMYREVVGEVGEEEEVGEVVVEEQDQKLSQPRPVSCKDQAGQLQPQAQVYQDLQTVY